MLSIIIMSEIFRNYDNAERSNCSKCHKLKMPYSFRIDGRIFKTCNSCRHRARELRIDRLPIPNMSSVSLSSSAAAEPIPNEINELVQSISDLFISSSSSSSACASASYFVAEPEPEPEPSLLKQVRGLALM